MRKFYLATALILASANLANAGGVSMQDMDNRAFAEQNRQSVNRDSSSSFYHGFMSLFRSSPFSWQSWGSALDSARARSNAVQGRTSQERSTGYGARQ